jgi:hypothetical protein
MVFVRGDKMVFVIGDERLLMPPGFGRHFQSSDIESDIQVSVFMSVNFGVFVFVNVL